MSQDDTPHQEDEHEGAENQNQAADSPGPIAISTADPEIVMAVDHPSDWTTNPDSTVRVETTQTHEPSPLYFAVRAPWGSITNAVRACPTRVTIKGGINVIKTAISKFARGAERPMMTPNRPIRKIAATAPQPSLAKSMLMSAAIALLCGFIGAFGYSYMSGSRSDKSGSDKSQSDKSQSKDKSSSKKKSDSDTSSGSGGDESGDELKSKNTKANSIPGSMSASEGDCAHVAGHGSDGARRPS